MSSCVLPAMGLQHAKMRRSSSISRSARGALLAGFGPFSTISYAICLTVSVLQSRLVLCPHSAIALRPVSEPAHEVRDTTQSPFSHPDTSSDPQSPVRSGAAMPVSSASITVHAAPTLAGPALAPLPMTTIPPVPAPRGVAQVSLPHPGNLAQSAQPGDVNEDVSDLGRPPDTPRKQHASPSEASAEVPATPSTPSDLLPAIETPSKRSPVRFGCAPDRVLTQAPPKKTSGRRRTAKPSKQGRIKSNTG